MNKTLSFSQHLVPLILSGEKTVTWRLWDDKELTVGDIVEFIEKGHYEPFTIAQIVKITEKPMGNLTSNDKKGHEKFSNDKKMYETYSRYYVRSVDHTTLVKIVRFKVLK